jgi:hypothetical protein
MKRYLLKQHTRHENILEKNLQGTVVEEKWLFYMDNKIRWFLTLFMGDFHMLWDTTANTAVNVKKPQTSEVPRCSSAETQVCHRSYIIAATSPRVFSMSTPYLKFLNF